MRRLAWTGAAMLLAAGVAMPHAVASAAGQGAVSLNAQGVKSISLFTYRDSTSGWATFSVVDPDGLAANVSQCDVTVGGSRINCDSYPLRAMNDQGGAWKIRPTSDGWIIRIFIGYYDVDVNQCWQWRDAARLGVEIALLSSDERLLKRQTHSFQVQCSGVAARMSGNSTLIARWGADSRRFPVKTTVLDRRHEVKSVRQCFFDVDAGETTNCTTYPIGSSGKRTASGWTITRLLTYNNPGRTECREISRYKPRWELRLSYRDRDGDSIGSSRFGFRITCQM